MFFIKCHHKFSNGSFKKVRRSFVSLFLASKRQANKNFNQIVFLFREVICLFCLKQKFIWRSFNKKLQNSFLKFFPNKFFLKVYLRFLGRSLVTLSGFQITVKQANVINYENGVRLRGMQVRCFYQHKVYKHILAETRSNLSIN